MAGYTLDEVNSFPDAPTQASGGYSFDEVNALPDAPAPEEPGLLRSFAKAVADPLSKIGGSAAKAVLPSFMEGSLATGKAQSVFGGDVNLVGYKDGRELQGSEFAKDLGGTILEGASYLPVGRVAVGGTKLLGKALLTKGALQNVPKLGSLAAEGALGGGLVGTGSALQRNEDLSTSLQEGAVSAGVGAIAAPIIGGVAPKIASSARKVIPELMTKEGRLARNINKREKDIYDIETGYTKLNQKNAYKEDARNESRSRIANTDVLVNSVDTDGKITTKAKGGAIDQYKAQTIDGRESVVKDLLKAEGKLININDVAKYLEKTILADEKLAGGSLESAYSRINSTVKGLERKADANGNIPLDLLHSAKISETANINYSVPSSKAEAKAVARGLKEIIENTSDQNIKEINDELAKYYSDIEMLADLDGKKVKGGKLGKYFATGSGNIIGALAGNAVGGPFGGAVGAAVGGEISGRILGSQMANTFGKALGKTVEKSTVLQKAQENVAKLPLRLPAPKFGRDYIPTQEYNRGNPNIKYNTTNTRNKITTPNSLLHTNNTVNKEVVDNLDHLSEKDKATVEQWLNKNPDETERQLYNAAKQLKELYDRMYEDGVEKYRGIIKYIEGGSRNKFGVLPEMGVSSGKNSNGRYLAKGGAPLEFQKRGDTFLEEKGFKDKEEAQNFIDNFQKTIEQRDLAKKDLESFRNPALKNSYGFVAGFQVDEDGNVKFSPEMAVLGAVGGNLASKINKDTVGKVVKATLPKVYKETGDLTTKILKSLEGKATVSKQFILDATNRGELKQTERDLVRKIAETEGNVVDVAKFADKVKAELLPLTVKNQKVTVAQAKSQLKNMGYTIEKEMDGGASILDKNGDYVEYDKMTPEAKKLVDRVFGTAETYDQIGGNKYESIALPDELRGKVKNYKENIYESPIKTSAGSTHFGGQTDNYFGHTRIEDMADNKTRRVIEVQSDLYQKGNLERELPVTGSESRFLDGADAQRLRYINGRMQSMEHAVNGKDYLDEYKQLKSEAEALRAKNNAKESEVLGKRKKEIAPLMQYNDPTAHFRMIREEIKKAAEDGKTKLQFPTGETAMKIEGLGSQDNWSVMPDTQIRSASAEKLTKDNLAVGKEVYLTNDAGDNWIITDVLGDGKFKATPKTQWEKYNWKVDFKTAYDRLYVYRPDTVETFDVSGKVDSNNPIYKFYNKEVRNYLNKFGGKEVVDDKGVSWIEIPINKEQGNMPVEAFGIIGAAGLGAAATGSKEANAESNFDWETKTEKTGIFKRGQKFERKDITHPENVKKFEELYKKNVPKEVQDMLDAVAYTESKSGQYRVHEKDQKDGSDSVGLLHMGQKALDEFNKRKESFGYTGPDLKIKDLKEKEADIIQKYVQGMRILRDMKVNGRSLYNATTFIQNPGEENYGKKVIKKYENKL